MKIDSEQKKIFIHFVDKYKDIIKDKRYKFVATHLADGSTIIGHPLKPNIDFKISKIDFEALSFNNLFNGYYLDSPHTMQFIISLEALEVYELLKKEKILPLDRVENDSSNYIKSKEFIEKYPRAYQKWLMAEELYLKETNNKNLTTIGHLCRESLQEFSEELLVNKFINKKFPKSHIIAKIKYVFETIGNNSSSTEKFLDSLLNYWGNVSDLVQKQEHGAQKEKSVLKINDARRIIFHSAIVMYEIDKTIF